MQAVLISAYVMLLVAITSEGQAHADENSARLAAIEAAVNQNVDTIASLKETLSSMNAMMHHIIHHYMKDSCMFNDLPYPNGSTVEGVCNKQTCTNGGWIADMGHTNPLCCKFNGTHYPDGSILEGNSCNPTCTRGKWIVDNSTLCCKSMGTWFTNGTNLKGFDLNGTCEDGHWNLIVYNPVLEFRLVPGEENVESILIRYNPGIYTGYDRNWDSMSYWVDSLNEFIRPYETDHYDSNRHYWYMKDCVSNGPGDGGGFCQFNDNWLGDKCTKAEDWGYSSSSPCIILKMNRMIGWIPDVYKTIQSLPPDMPEDLKEHIKLKTDDNGGNVPRMVWVHCKCENPDHEVYIREIEYTRWQGFPTFYFPYLETRETLGYQDPIVAVRFDVLANNIPINIECKAYAKNIVHNRQKRLGVIQFELTKLG